MKKVDTLVNSQHSTRSLFLNFRSVFILAEPAKIPLHNLYEFVWLLKTGIPRMLRILAGNEAFIADPKILKEGYEHYTP